jgi:hypothetical protein
VAAAVVTEAEGLAAVAAAAVVVAAADAGSNPALKSNSRLWERLWPQLPIWGERERTPTNR